MTSIDVPTNEQTEADQALRELYERLGPAVLSRCLYLLRDQSEAEDALQEVFARVSQHLAQFRSDPSPLAAIMQLATHHGLNVIRGSKGGWSAEQHRTAGLRPSLEAGTLEGPDLVRAVLGAVDMETQAAAIHFHVDALPLETLATWLGRPIPELRERLATFAAIARNREEPTRTGSSSGAEEDSLAIPGTRQDGCPRWSLRRLRAGELPHEEAAGIETHVAGCARCKAAGAEHEAEEDALRQRADFSLVADTIRRKQTYQRRRRWAGPVSVLLAVGLTTLMMWSPVRQLACGNSRGAVGDQSDQSDQSDAVLERYGTGDGSTTGPVLVDEGDLPAPLEGTAPDLP